MKPPLTPRLVFLLAIALVAPVFAAAPQPLTPVGVARVDITPEMPIRLSGYGGRPGETKTIETPLFARALAIGGGDQAPVVLIAAELIGIGESLGDDVAAAIRARHPEMARAQVAISTTHVHTGPSVAGVLPYMFSKDLPEDERARIERYTETLRAKLAEVALQALADRKPARLSWAEGKVGFAAQRRVIVDGKWKTFGVVPEGPVDHALPVMRVADEHGAIRAVWTSYACHCTTLGGGDNYVHSDWAGDAARRIETAHPGSVALVSIGCGADANPNPRGPAAVATHGASIASEVDRLLGGTLRPLGAVTGTSYRRIELPLDRPPGLEQLRARAADRQRAPASYAAMKFLAELEAGRSLPAAVPYPVQTWRFGNDLAIVFLGGEVVSEYSLRLRRELDGARLWVNACSNSVPCYIPSKRMYPEGGYELDGSMDYYGWPTRLAIGTEDRIVATVDELLPPAFDSKTSSSR